MHARRLRGRHGGNGFSAAAGSGLGGGSTKICLDAIPPVREEEVQMDNNMEGLGFRV